MTIRVVVVDDSALVRSLLTAFPQELERHRGGACCATRRDPAFPVPAPTSDWR